MPHAVDWCCMKVIWGIYFDIWRLGVSRYLNINMSWVHSTSFTYCNQSLHFHVPQNKWSYQDPIQGGSCACCTCGLSLGLWGWCVPGPVAMEKMADSPPISVLKLLVSQNFYNKLQHVITSLTFSLQPFCYVCCLHAIFSEVLLGLGLIGFKNRSSMRVPIMSGSPHYLQFHVSFLVTKDHFDHLRSVRTTIHRRNWSWCHAAWRDRGIWCFQIFGWPSLLLSQGSFTVIGHHSIIY